VLSFSTYILLLHWNKKDDQKVYILPTLQLAYILFNHNVWDNFGKGAVAQEMLRKTAA
jgi:hypothetical protein